MLLAFVFAISAVLGQAPEIPSSEAQAQAPTLALAVAPPPTLEHTPVAAPAQADTLSLRLALAQAEAAFPLSRRSRIEDQISARAALDVGVSLKPNVSFSSQALWQSHVPDLPFALPGESSLAIPHDQYKAGFTFSKVVWDGGRTRAAQDLILEQPSLSRAEVAVNLVDVREGVLLSYFAIIELDVQLETLRLLRTDIEARLAQIENAIAAGVKRETDADALLAEILRIRQHIVEVEGARRGVLESLSIRLGRSLPEDIQLEIEPRNWEAPASTRPEFALFARQQAIAALAVRVTEASQRPLVSAFAETAVGRPAGQNFFDDRIRPFATVGVRLSWPLLNWGRTKRSRETAVLRSEAVVAAQETFQQGMNAQLASEKHLIGALQESISLDEQIIQIRNKVAARVGIEFQNGTATAADFLVEKNAAHQAVLAAKVRRIRLALAKARHYNTSGGR